MSGLFGMFSTRSCDAADLTYLGLYALQHRGQESAGMVVSDGNSMRIHKGMGLVSQVFDENILKALPGRISLGHVRYATAGTAHVANAQPLMSLSRHGRVALAHDGNLTNVNLLRAELLENGLAFQTTTDSEVILDLLAVEAGIPLEEAARRAARRLTGAYAICAMTHDCLIGLRDPLGIRPLSIGRLGDAWILASESCAFDTVGAELVRDVRPGEMVVIDERGLRSEQFAKGVRDALCVFEFIYFARADSVISGKSVHEVRKEIGRLLACETSIEADVVIPAPDSAASAALGYAEQAGIPYDVGLAKNRYVGRTFTQPTDALRKRGVHIKLNPIGPTLKGRRVILVDDSIVRGTTSKRTIQLLKSAGASEVHMVVASPPFTHPCHYGIDVPNSEELIAANRTLDEVRRLIGADSLHYLNFESLYQAIGVGGEALCTACFGGAYPTPVEDGPPISDNFLEEKRVRR